MPGLLFLKVDRAWDRIRDDARFAALRPARGHPLEADLSPAGAVLVGCSQTQSVIPGVVGLEGVHMGNRIRLAGLVAAVSMSMGADALACGDKFLVAGRGTRYQRPKNARAANVLIYANPASGLPAALQSVPVDTLLKREGHRSTTVETLDQLAAILAGGRFDVVLAASTVASAVEKLLGGAADAPVMVAFCIKPTGPEAVAATAPCTVKTPPKERSFLEAIDKAVLTHDKNAKKALARG